ncbi:adenylation DNA ligase-like domain-containing protein [Pandoravirus kuranda]|uniref:Adenylation DNA ligase-like domain-containing protein n=1 Tax=Pandoravirus kuranda TaxID=3019033 RepID=A0AA95EEG4_9VIRU|nr:adenylation DNA ligase-like domain-containing protein [Pandoravirus kuranda]
MFHPSIPHLNTQKASPQWAQTDPDGVANYRWFIEEKIDGSQLSFQRQGDAVEFRNRSKVIASEALGNWCYANAVRAITRLADRLNPAYTYHGEAVCKRRHNVVAYAGTPLKFWICYGIYDGERHLDRAATEVECARLGIQCVQVLYANEDPDNRDPTPKVLEIVARIEAGEIKSCLGGNVIEGVVVKHSAAWHARSKAHKHIQFKHVTSAFKERHGERRPPLAGHDADSLMAYLARLGSSFALPAVYQKAVQHMREDPTGEATTKAPSVASVKREVERDIQKENGPDIVEAIVEAFMPIVMHHATADIARWLSEQEQEQQE